MTSYPTLRSVGLPSAFAVAVLACGEGAIRFFEVQRAGGKPVTGPEFLHGAKLTKFVVLP